MGQPLKHAHAAALAFPLGRSCGSVGLVLSDAPAQLRSVCHRRIPLPLNDLWAH